MLDAKLNKKHTSSEPNINIKLVNGQSGIFTPIKIIEPILTPKINIKYAKNNENDTLVQQKP